MLSYLPEGFLMKTQENIAALKSFEQFKEAYIKGKQLEARAALCDKDHNLHIDLGFVEGIIPRSECAVGIDDGTTKDIAIIARVNKPVRFIVTDLFSAGGKQYAYLSRKAVQEDFYKNRLPYLKRGDVIDATVTHLESFGAFCDIGCGINALLPIDNISVSRIPHPAVRFGVGDEIKAVVKDFDAFGRVTLSHKELLGTWEENAELFSVGETVSGIVRSVESYGVFIELTPNLAGLAEYSSDVFVGQYTGVYIKSIIKEKMKFKLIIVDAFDADYPRKKTVYFTQSDHIDYFRYSPENAEKLIETRFED